jgi:hypothetical protein
MYHFRFHFVATTTPYYYSLTHFMTYNAHCVPFIVQKGI